MLEVKNLCVSLHDKPILDGLNLTVEKGQVAAIMGPNGSGKSTLSYVIAGKPDYEMTGGEVRLHGENLYIEATNSKISEDPLSFRQRRGIADEEATALIVNGFVRDVLQQLPMEFAVEAQKLIAISREGSVA